MTDHLHVPHDSQRLTRVFERAVTRARVAILAEKTWTRLAPAVAVSGLFLSASWFGLWQAAPHAARLSGVALFGVSMLAAGYLPFRKAALPTRQDALDRLDRLSGRDDRPATRFDDRLAAHSGGEQQELWALYRDRLATSLGSFRAGLPRSELPVKDPYALRTLLLMLTVASFAVADGRHSQRIASAFDWTPPPPAPILPAVEAWLTPPAYTKLPPASLSNAQHDAVSETKDFIVPAGTVLTLHIYKDKTARIFTEGGATVPDVKEAELPDTIQKTFQLNSNANIYIEGNDHTEMRWRFSVLPDHPPTVDITAAPETVKNRTGSIIIPYAVQDEYGAPLTNAQIAIEGVRPDQAAPPIPPLMIPAR